MHELDGVRLDEGLEVDLVGGVSITVILSEDGTATGDGLGVGFDDEGKGEL